MLLAGVVLAVAGITVAVRVRSSVDSDAGARTKAALAIGLAAVAILLATIAGIDLYAIGISELWRLARRAYTRPQCGRRNDPSRPSVRWT